jgi:hypothetical protein
LEDRVGNTPDAIPHFGFAGWYHNGMSSCPGCGLEFDSIIDHCHGTLVVHRDRTLECTDPACQLPELLRHDLIIDCMAVLGGCCAADDSMEISAAS